MRVDITREYYTLFCMLFSKTPPERKQGYAMKKTEDTAALPVMQPQNGEAASQEPAQQGFFTSVFKHRRTIWYFVLLIASSVFLWFHRFDLFSFDPFNVVTFIFLFWVILLIYPLFSEMELLGVKLKKEVEKVKQEVQKAAGELKMQIMNVRNSSSSEFHVHYASLPSQQELDALSEKKRTLQPARSLLLAKDFKFPKTLLIPKTAYMPAMQTLIPMDKTPGDDSEGGGTSGGGAYIEMPDLPEENGGGVTEFTVSETAKKLFNIRYALETKLKTLCVKCGCEDAQSITQMLRYLCQNEILDSVTVDVMIQIVRIANRGIHGEEISSSYLTFVNDMLPDIWNDLDYALEHPYGK